METNKNNSQYVIGIDIGGTSLRIGLVDKNGVPSSLEQVKQNTVFHGDSVKALIKFIENYIAHHSVDNNIAGLAIALPGILDLEKNVILNLPNVSGFNGIPLKSILQSHFSFPVYLLKDVSALYTYDAMRFKLNEAGVIIACYVGTGLGNAICIDGKLLDGSHGVAGELGHIPIWGFSTKCGCGNEGCAEAVAAGVAVSRIHEQDFPDISIDDLFTKYPDSFNLHITMLLTAMTISAEINILDPHTVILGGGVLMMNGYPIERLKERILSHTRKPLPAENLKFIISDNPGENGVIGSGIYAWKNIDINN